MRRFAGLVLLASAAVLMGCSGAADPGGPGGGAGPGTPSEPPDPGEPGDETSLWLEIRTAQPVPGSVESPQRTLTLDSVRLVLEDVRAVGDAAPGDERTTLDRVDIEWGDDDAPEPLAFGDPPVGVYSRIVARVRSVEIEGELETEGAGGGDDSGEDDGNDELEFVLEVEPASLSLDVALGSLDVAPGVATTIELTFDAGQLVDAADWSLAEPVEGGDVFIDGDRQPAVLSALENALRLAPTDTDPE